MFNRIWTIFKAKAPLLPHPVAAAQCGGRELLLLLHPIPVQLPLYPPGLDQEEREEVVTVSLDWHRHSPPWRPLGWQNPIDDSFLWPFFVSFEEIFPIWIIPVSCHDGGNVSHLLLASNFFLSPWPSGGHSLKLVMQPEIASDWLLP